MNIQKSTLESFVTVKRDPNQEEQLFEAVYKWAENQVGSNEDSQKNVDKNEAIKELLAGVLPHIKFHQMHTGYFSEFVALKGLLTFEECISIICEHHKICVKASDFFGGTLNGSFVETFEIFDQISKCSIKAPSDLLNTPQWPCNVVPTHASNLKKNENVPFYLVLANKCLEIKKPAVITENDYLLCEMKGSSNFVLIAPVISMFLVNDFTTFLYFSYHFFILFCECL